MVIHLRDDRHPALQHGFYLFFFSRVDKKESSRHYRALESTRISIRDAFDRQQTVKPAPYQRHDDGGQY
jgi:hypothetical protein